MLRAVTFLLLLCITFLANSLAYGARDPLDFSLPEIEIMPGATWQGMGQRMALNGVPMSAKIFSYRGRIEDVEQYYLDLLRSKGHGKLKQTRLGERVILGYQLGEFHYSIQMAQAGGVVEGKAVVTPSPLEFRTSMKTTLPVPPRSTVLSKVESLDAGRRAETLTMDSRFDVSYVVDFYLDQLAQDQWQLFSRSGDGKNSAVLSFQRGSELLQLTVKGLQANNSQKCQFLINWIK
jgi:hypothetical protein